MSTTSSTQRQGATATSRRESATTSTQPSATVTTSSRETSKPTTLDQHTSLLNLDNNPTSSATKTLANDVASATASSIASTPICASDRECSGDQICSRGACASVNDAAPFSPVGEQTSHMSTGGAIGVGLCAVSFMLLLFGLGLWVWRRRGKKSPNVSIEAPPIKRNRSASSATDQKTLVSSLSNSPQHTGSREQRYQLLTASFAQLVTSNKILEYTQTENDRAATTGQTSSEKEGHRKSRLNEKRLPLPPNNMLLPPPPIEEKKYAVNANINKSMISDEAMYNMTSTLRDTGTPRNQIPKYRFEEYHPPILSTPPLSMYQISSKSTSEIEMEAYPRKRSSSTVHSNGDDEKDVEMDMKRKSVFMRPESKPPQLPFLELLPPSSPSLSFKSFGWCQDIIGTEQTNIDDPVLGSSTTSVSDRIPNRSPTQGTFGAALPQKPPALDTSLLPAPLSATRASFSLYPNSAALPSPASATFQLSPAVYVMPSRPQKARPLRASMRSTTTQNTHMSRSWLPDDGLCLPEEGTNNSYTLFKRYMGDGSQPTGYTPL